MARIAASTARVCPAIARKEPTELNIGAAVGVVFPGRVMPLLSILSSTVPAPARRAEALGALSRLLAHELDKPLAYVMVAIEQPLDMSFGGDAAAPSCYAELKNVGTLPAQRFESLSAVLCAELSRTFQVAPDRIYIEFTNADGSQWGWNGTTFA